MQEDRYVGNPFDSDRKRRRREHFIAYTDCLNNLLHRNTVENEIATKILDEVKPFGENLDFIVGELATCYDKVSDRASQQSSWTRDAAATHLSQNSVSFFRFQLRLEDFKPLVDLLASKSPEKCEFSDTELEKLESLFLMKCDGRAAIIEQLRLPLAHKMMCGSSFNSIVFNNQWIAQINLNHLLHYVDYRHGDNENIGNEAVICERNMKEEKHKKIVSGKELRILKRDRLIEKKKKRDEAVEADAKTPADQNTDPLLPRPVIFVGCFLFGFFLKRAVDSCNVPY